MPENRENWGDASFDKFLEGLQNLSETVNEFTNNIVSIPQEAASALHQHINNINNAISRIHGAIETDISGLAESLVREPENLSQIFEAYRNSIQAVSSLHRGLRELPIIGTFGVYNQQRATTQNMGDWFVEFPRELIDKISQIKLPTGSSVNLDILKEAGITDILTSLKPGQLPQQIEKIEREVVKEKESVKEREIVEREPSFDDDFDFDESDDRYERVTDISRPSESSNNQRPFETDENPIIPSGGDIQEYMFPPYKGVTTYGQFSTTALPYQDLAEAIKMVFRRPAQEIEELAQVAKQSFEIIAGGFSRERADFARQNIYPTESEAIIRSLSNFANKYMQRGVKVDEILDLAFSKLLTNRIEGLPEQTKFVLQESIGREQYALLKSMMFSTEEGGRGIVPTLEFIMSDLQHLKSVPTIRELPMNVGSPEFYRGFLGLPTEKSAVPADAMGILLNDLKSSLTNTLGIIARQLFPEHNFKTQMEEAFKALGSTFFSSEGYQKVIPALTQIPGIGDQLAPQVSEFERILNVARLNRQLTEFRNQFNNLLVNRQIPTEIQFPEQVGVLESAFGGREQFQNKLTNIENFVKAIGSIGNLSENAIKARDNIVEFIQNLRNIPEGGLDTPLNIAQLQENLRVLTDEAEKSVRGYFNQDFRTFVENLRKATPHVRQLNIPEEAKASFFAFTSSLSDIVDSYRKIQGELTAGERFKLWARNTLELPSREFMALNITNFQWALLLGLSSSVMDVMTRPAYETVYTAIQPIYTTIGNLTGLSGLVEALQRFPYEIQQMTSLLQTSLNSISSLLGSRFYSQEAIRTATEIARVQPIQLPEAIEVLTAISTYPTTRPYARDFEFQRRIFDIVQMLSLLAPEQGIQGALFAIREALGGQWRSLQMRFNISPEVLAQYAGVKPSEFRSASGIELINNMYTALTRMFGGERVLLQKGAQLDIQVENIIDTLISSLVLPLVSQQNSKLEALVERWLQPGEKGAPSIMEAFMPQQYAMLERLAMKQVEKTGKTPEQIEAEKRAIMTTIAKETWGTPIGFVSGMVSMLNNALSEILGTLNVSDFISNLISDFGEKFQRRVEEYRRSIATLDISKGDFTDKQRKFARDFIAGILTDLSDEIKNVTGIDFGSIFAPLIDAVRSAIMGMASEVSSAVLQQSLKVALELPGNFGELLLKQPMSIYTSFTKRGAEGGFENLLGSISGLAAGLSGGFAWIYLMSLKDAIQEAGYKEQAWWSYPGVREKGMQMVGMMIAGGELSKEDWFSKVLGLSTFAVMNYLPKLSLKVDIGKSIRIPFIERSIPVPQRFQSLQFGSGAAFLGILAAGIADEARTSGQLSQAAQAIVGALSGALQGATTGLMTGNLYGVLLGALVGGALGGMAGYKEAGTREENVINRVRTYLARQYSTLYQTEKATIEQQKVLWQTSTGVEFWKPEKEGVVFSRKLEDLSRLYNIYMQMPTITATNISNQVAAYLQQALSGNKQIIPSIISQIFELTQKYYSQLTQIQQLPQKEQLQRYTELRSDLRKEVERILPGRPDIAEQVTQIITAPQREFLINREAAGQAIQQFMNQIKPAILWEQLNTVFRAEPTKIPELKTPADIPNFIEKVRQALAEFVDALKASTNEIKGTEKLALYGFIPIDTLRKQAQMYGKLYYDILMSPGGAQKAAYILPQLISFLTSKEAMMWAPDIVFGLFGSKEAKERLNQAVEIRMEMQKKQIEQGTEVIEGAKKMKEAEIPSVTGILQQLNIGDIANSFKGLSNVIRAGANDIRSAINELVRAIKGSGLGINKEAIRTLTVEQGKELTQATGNEGVLTEKEMERPEGVVINKGEQQKIETPEKQSFGIFDMIQGLVGIPGKLMKLIFPEEAIAPELPNNMLPVRETQVAPNLQQQQLNVNVQINTGNLHVNGVSNVNING